MADPNKKTKDTLYTWNNKNVNKQFSDSINLRRNFSKKMFKQGMNDRNFDLAAKGAKFSPGPGTLTKKYDGGEHTVVYGKSGYGNNIKTSEKHYYKGKPPKNYKMNIGDKQKDTPGNFSEKDSSIINVGGFDPKNSIKLKVKNKNLNSNYEDMKKAMDAMRERNKGKWGQ